MVNVYVPAQGSIYGEWIARGSGIVGGIDQERRILKLDFEGDVYDAYNLVTFADRVHVAWRRHNTEHPTKARVVASPEQFAPAGRYNPQDGHVLVDDPDALARWLDVDRVPDEELFTTGGDAATERYWKQKASETADPALRLVAKQQARRYRKKKRT